MTAPIRYDRLGLTGRQSTSKNTLDSRFETFEVPITLVASAAEQDTGIKIPNHVQAATASIYVKTAEATGTTKSVSVGFVGTPTAFVNAADVSATGNRGDVVTNAWSPAGANISYTLGSADFAELDATAVITLIGWD